MKHYLTILLVGLFALSLAVQAKAEPHVFDAMYFFIVNINPGSATSVLGRKAVLYEAYPEVVRSSADSSGKAIISAFDNRNIPINPSGTYYVAVENDPTDNFGADPVRVNITGRGFEKVNLTLALGAGPTPIVPVILSDNGLIQGTVIERAAEAPGSSIRIKFRSKDATTTMANIFRLSGTDTSYTSATDSWTSVASNVPITLPGTPTETVWNGETEITVGDTRNAYYRVVPSTVTDRAQIFGSDPSGTPYNERTVGKVDVLIQRNAASGGIKYNTFAVNLLPQSGIALDSVFPPQLFVSVAPDGNKLLADQIREWDGANWEAYFKSSTGNSWKKVSSPTVVGEYKFNRGYMIRLQPAGPSITQTFRVTTVGLVLPVAYQSNAAYNTIPPIGELGGTLKYTSIGNPFPKTASFTTAFATNYTAGELTKLTTLNKLQSDQVRYWDAVAGNWASCYLAGDGYWKLNTSDEAAFNLMMGTGYMFRKADDSTKGAFIWKY